MQPRLSTAQIMNMCVGFMGIQFGFALQNANMSRIFQTLGAEMNELAILWIAAPLTGLLVQPIIGYYSDRTWTRFGRRRPFFLAGAILSAIALFAMPHAHVLWMAALMLWVLDASINTSMEPFRAFVGDNLPPKQRPFGYALQSFFIGVGAVVASSLPWFFTQIGVSNEAIDGELPKSVIYSFYFGGAIFFGAVLWTVITSKEYSPEELAKFNEAHDAKFEHVSTPSIPVWSVASFMLGLALGLGTFFLGWAKELYVMSGLLVSVFVLFGLGTKMHQAGKENLVVHLAADLLAMPATMRRLAVVQFFTWFALFSMWIYTTAAVTSFHFGTTDVTSSAYNEGANWVGVMFSVYNGVGMVVALMLPFFTKRFGTPAVHATALSLGGLGLISYALINEPNILLISMVGVGIAWAAILSLPYALLSNTLPSSKMGTYMGIFNLFIVIPQLIAASVLGVILSVFFDNQPIWAIVMGGVSFLIAAATLYGFKDKN